jgi:hypothetical protein
LSFFTAESVDVAEGNIWQRDKTILSADGESNRLHNGLMPDFRHRNTCSKQSNCHTHSEKYLQRFHGTPPDDGQRQLSKQPATKLTKTYSGF